MGQNEVSGVTARQADFLQAVRELCQQGEGVHYSEVADRLGVSRWTAYDVLSSLAQRGYLTVEREERPPRSVVGRCRVLFRPTERPLQSPEQWRGWEDRLGRLQSDIREKGALSVLQELLGELTRSTRPVSFCAVVTLGLVLAVRVVGRGPELVGSLGSVLSWLMSSDGGLVAFAGAVAGVLLQCGLPRELHTSLLKHLPAFEQEVGSLGEQGKENLRQFTLTAIREVLGEPSPA
ncbi:MAG TPA: hypothetical protein GX513_13565 [Firmicutes bacterium]|nr:hypothetical protein [Bacillota bacterium]